MERPSSARPGQIRIIQTAIPFFAKNHQKRQAKKWEETFAATFPCAAAVHWSWPETFGNADRRREKSENGERAMARPKIGL